MPSIFNNVFNAGIKAEFQHGLQEKIRISNILAMASAFGAALPFVFITYFLYPTITWIPILGFLVVLLGVLFNLFGLNYIGRIVISLSLFSLATLYHAYILKDGESIILGLYIMQLTFATFPFMVFHINNVKSIIITLSFCFLGLFFFSELNVLLKEELDANLIKDSWLNDATIIMGISLFFFSILMLSFINNNSSKKVQSLEDLFAEIDEKNLQMKKDQELLEENFTKLRATQEEEKKRNWITEGMTELVTLIRNRQEEKDFYFHLLSFIVKYMEGSQGVIYTTEKEHVNDEAYLEVKASYAFRRKKNLQEKLMIGESLVGQVYRDKDMIYLTEVPENYVNITSGLGDAPPRSIIIVPLMQNDIVEGVLELASFKEVAKHQKEFLKQVAITLASTIFNVKINNKTKELLEESQQQAEEMRAQEEEMRQNMEELQATQEESERRSRDYENEIANLKEQLSTT